MLGELRSYRILCTSFSHLYFIVELGKANLYTPLSHMRSSQ